MESMVLEVMVSMVLMVMVMVIMMTMAIMMVLAVDNALFTAMVAIRMVTIMMKRALRNARSGARAPERRPTMMMMMMMIIIPS